MYPAQNWNSKPASVNKKAWNRPEIKRLGKLSDDELKVVNGADDPSLALVEIYRKRMAKGAFDE